MMQKIYEPPTVEVIQVVLEEGLAQATQCSPINLSDIRVEEWGADVTDNYGDIYLPDTW